MTELNQTILGQPEPLLRLNLLDPGDKELTGYSARILMLLQRPRSQQNHFLVATLDDFLGVLYALIFAKYNNHPFESREGPIEIQTVVKRAEDVAQGIVRTSGNWLAGFHFNSALFRIAAAYHRGLKVVSGKTSRDFKKDALLARVEPDFPNWQHTNLDKIWGEVNGLKHAAKGLFGSRSVSRREANGAVAELLELFELWSNEKAQ